MIDRPEAGKQVEENGQHRFAYGVMSDRYAYRYLPKDDMTVAELSHVMTMLNIGILAAVQIVPVGMVDAVFSSFPDNVRRHFEVAARQKIIQAPGPIRMR